MRLSLTQYCLSLLWLLCHRKWLRDIRDIAVHLLHSGNMVKGIKVAQDTLDININIPVQMHQCESCQTALTHCVPQPCFQALQCAKRPFCSYSRYRHCCQNSKCTVDVWECVLRNKSKKIHMKIAGIIPQFSCDISHINTK